MLFDELSGKVQERLKTVYFFEPDEVNAMFKSVEEVHEFLKVGTRQQGKGKSSKIDYIDDGEEDGEIDVKLSKGEQAAVDSLDLSRRQAAFPVDKQVTSEDVKGVEELLASLKELPDDEED